MPWRAKESWITVTTEELLINFFLPWTGKLKRFDQNDQVIVIAATNLHDSLDPAVKRSGRFDRVVHIPSPNFISR
jgi:ATP-dependent 26S proteasome regulatory subunit